MTEALAITSQAKTFTPGVENALRSKYADAKFTIAPARETPRSLTNVVEFDYSPALDVKKARSRFRLATDTQIVYLPDMLGGSYVEAFDDSEENVLRIRRMIDPRSERRNAQVLLKGLDKMPGVKWVIPSRALVARILVDHLQTYGEHLLRRDFIWTSDQMETHRGNNPHLVVGRFDGKKILVDSPLGGVGRGAGVLLVGVPEKVFGRRYLHLVQG